ncbi:MAG: hypothetical protein H6R17_295 [Proteobacteria bacterium]|nr:hypothetical protein [Pseudomonadota bacterium]
MTSSRYPLTARRLLVPVLFCIALSIYLLGGVLDAQWSVYADHELRSYWVGHQSLSLADIPRIMLQTEVGHPGEFTRYRPTNYLMYALEGVLWGDNPMWLNGVRLANLATFLVVTGVVLCRYFSSLITVGLCALLMTAHYWKHVLIGFGANEQYILLVAPMFLWSYVRIYPTSSAAQRPSGASHSSLGWWLLCCLSAALLAGIKENMTIVILPMAWLAGLHWLRVRRLDLRLVLTVLTCLTIGFIIGAVMIGVRQVGTDFYGNSVTLGHRVSTLLIQTTKYPMPIMLSVLLGLGLVGYLRVPTGSKPPVCSVLACHARRLFLPQAGLVVLSIAHIFFYEGWPLESRYAFPGEFFVFLTGTIVLKFSLEAIRICYPSYQARSDLFFGLALISIAMSMGYSGIRNQVEAYTVASREFTQTLNAIVAQAKANPDTAIVVESATPYDLEPVFSINRYLLSFEVNNPIYLRLHNLGIASFPDNSFFHGLIRTLEHLSAEGEVSSVQSAGTLPSPFLAKFSRIDRFEPALPCFSIQLAQAPVLDCKRLGTVKY